VRKGRVVAVTQVTLAFIQPVCGKPRQGQIYSLHMNILFLMFQAGIVHENNPLVSLPQKVHGLARPKVSLF
jgi:hypothetical protein